MLEKQLDQRGLAAVLVVNAGFETQGQTLPQKQG